MLLGLADGEGLGAADGDADGDALGLTVGCAEGDTDGSDDTLGANDGAFEMSKIVLPVASMMSHPRISPAQKLISAVGG